MSGSASYLSLHLWNPAKCEVDGLVVRVDVLASIGRSFGRYRVVLVAWSLGITAIINVIAYAAFDAGGALTGRSHASYILKPFSAISDCFAGHALLSAPSDARPVRHSLLDLFPSSIRKLAFG